MREGSSLLFPEDSSGERPVQRPTHEAHDRGQPVPIQVEYRILDPRAPLPPNILAAVHFGPQSLGAALHGASPALEIEVGLLPLRQPAPTELWFSHGPVRSGRDGIVRYACDDHFLFALIEEPEDAYPGICAAGEAVYAALKRFQEQSAFPHLLRIWNYLDAINEGTGDMERYRQFCVGRACGLGLGDGANLAGGSATGLRRYPAATGIGHQRRTHHVQVFWLAARQPGTAIENPRQVSAYRYPRIHGPVSPHFSRATLAADGTLLVSGTASIVGHTSRHHDDVLAQAEEILRNLAELRGQASIPAPVPVHAETSQTETNQVETQQAGVNHAAPIRTASDDISGGHPARDLMKVYLRDPALLAPVAARLRRSWPDPQILFLAGDICRRELLLEIEGIQPLRQPLPAADPRTIT
ncbi:hypothetical protein ACG33_00610 [Steroidobacter denitrificans]|uniref:Chorismatase FkbO/Hyg5-like N-terminal domain-containing protein n=2 Tax=Steroidobacter denitrificans TaxID=465721 RepID=A0A127F7R4_STEDE|nr:hypothetical protein ACG33_00610 [Steroidobacter denitrificans]